MTPDFPWCPPQAWTPHGLRQEIAALQALRQRLLAEPHTASFLMQLGTGDGRPVDPPAWMPGHALASLCAARIAGLEAYALSLEAASAAPMSAAPTETGA